MSNGKRATRRRPRRGVHMLLVLALVVLGAGIYLVQSGRSDAEEPPRKETVPIHEVMGSQEIPAEPQEPAVPAEPELPEEPEEPPFSADDWELLLVNPWNKIPEDYTMTLTQLKNGHAVDERAYPDLQAMMDACRADGLSPVICSSFRTQEKQQSLFDRKVQRLIDANGYSKEVATVEAGKVVAVPGTSEHQTGLALDIVDESYQMLDDAQENTAVQKWLMEHSWEYGFVLRYPNSKSDITGIIYEPWHYRYVGKEAAAAMYEQDLTLEEFVEQLS